MLDLTYSEPAFPNFTPPLFCRQQDFFLLIDKREIDVFGATNRVISRSALKYFSVSSLYSIAIH